MLFLAKVGRWSKELNYTIDVPLTYTYKPEKRLLFSVIFPDIKASENKQNLNNIFTFY